MAPGKRKRTRVVNPEKVKGKAIKKQNATEGQSEARKKIEDARKRMNDKKAKKTELEDRATKARSQASKDSLAKELAKIEAEIMDVDVEIAGAVAQEEKFRKEAEDAENEDDFDELMLDDDEPDNPLPSNERSDKPDNPIPSNERPDDAALIAALLAGVSLGDQPSLDISLEAGLSIHEKVIGYKNGVGKAAIICNTEVEGCPVYRIRRNVVIGDNVPNIIKGRRAGTEKDEATGAKWGWSDVRAVRGIAIAVPRGYSGNAEDLVVPVEKFSAIEIAQRKLEGKPIPKQPDVQVLIEWKTPDKSGKVLSWESRTTSAALWKKATAETLWKTAHHVESHFRAGGGEDLAPFGMPDFGRSLSPGDLLGSDQMDSNRTTPEPPPEAPVAPKPPSNSKPGADKKAAARAEFKTDWCEEMNIQPENMTDADRGSFMASFKVYWDRLNEKS